MTRVPLGNDRFAFVDDADAPAVLAHRWHIVPSGKVDYAARRQSFYLHQFILGKLPGLEIDHINGDGLDCRRENLRHCTRGQNAANTRNRRAAPRYRGVYLRGKASWQASISCAGRWVYLGSFRSPESAALAYNEAARRCHGEFASLNVVDPDPAAVVTA